MGPRNHVLGGSLNSQGKRQFLEVVPSTEMHQTMSAENATTARDNRLVHRGQHVTTKARPQNGLTCYMGDRWGAMQTFIKILSPLVNSSDA